MAFELSEETRKRITDEILPKYDTKKSAVLAVLWEIQEERGYIDREAMLYTAEVVEQPAAHIYSLVTFYTMFPQQPQGKFHLKVCRTVSCEILGCKGLTEKITEKLGIAPGETTEDGMFTLEEVECLAACEMAPMVQVNEDCYGPLTPETMEQLIEDLRNGADRIKPCL